MANEVAGRFAPFEFVLDSWGFFPNPRLAKVMFIGTSQGQEINALARQLIMGAAAYTRESPDRFHPHLTVARFRQPVAVQSPQSLTPIKIPAREITLFSSELTANGPIYRAVDKFYFSGIARGE
jgi:2'-5' RNA ligase